MLKLLPIALLLLPVAGSATGGEDPSSFPWREAGLSHRQAAAHLLDRFTFGPRPGDLERVLDTGLETWFDRQLRGAFPDDEVRDRMRPLDAFGMSAVEIAQTFPRPGALLQAASRQGAMDPEELRRQFQGSGEEMSAEQRRARRRRVMAWAEEEGYRPQRQLIAQLYTQKILRATYSENQLHEVLTDLWFNHFNVSLTDNQSRGFVFSYERDAIRPHLVGSFRDLLGATARHPAMLTYLDNAQSTAAEGMPTTFEPRETAMRSRRGRNRAQGRRRPAPRQRSTGLNENFARELLELHTLGVEGGYSQEDVVEVARAFTGWTVVPPNRLEWVERRLQGARRAGGEGFYLEGLFLFRADAHDAGKKRVLGRSLPAGRGMEDGEAVLDLVASHPSTARHLATKLAVRFVGDEPPDSLVDRLARRFEATEGEIAEVLRELVRSPEFWSRDAVRQKVKSPFEVAISAVRGLDGDIYRPRWIGEWIGRMGQPLYAYQAPTGFPDRGEAWVNTGSLLNRMNFGLQLASGGIRGVAFDLAALNGGVEPESVDDALGTYLRLLLPERPAEPVLRQLGPVVRSPELAQRVARATSPAAVEETLDPELRELDLTDSFEPTDADVPEVGGQEQHAMLAQVVGVILGSPEFQRR